MQHYQCVNYANQQPNITPIMRTVLVDWMFDIAKEFSFPRSYVHRAVKYIDIFSEHKIIERAELQTGR